MKVVLDDGDLKYIEGVNKDIEERGIGDIPLMVHRLGQQYYINFTCTDIAKANSFILAIMNQHTDEAKDFEEQTGIHVNSFNYCNGDNKVTELKDYLQNFLQQLEKL